MAEPRSAEWWEEQALRYKAEVAELSRSHDELLAADRAEQKRLAEQIRDLEGQLAQAKSLAEARRGALADVLRATSVVVEKIAPLLAE